MKNIIDDDTLKVNKIEFCYRGKDKSYEYACLTLADRTQVVSTISYVSSEGLTVGDYLQGRIDDFNYCKKHRDLNTLSAEFEMFDESLHQINKTNIYGYTYEKVW